MDKSNTIRHGRHCVFNLHVHLVFVTKYRRKVFTDVLLRELKNSLTSVCTDFEAELVEFNGGIDHVHLLVTYPPKVSISELVNSLKGVSSRMLRRFPSARRGYYKNVLWSPSYFAASCGGAPLAILKRYIQNQAAPQPPFISGLKAQSFLAGNG